MGRRRRKMRVLFALLTLTTFISVIFGFVYRNFEKPFGYAFSAYATETGNEALRLAVDKCLSDVSYTDIISVTQNSDKEIVSVAANVSYLNRIKTEITKYADEYASNPPEKYVDIYLGATQNSPLFAAAGPKFRIKVRPYSVTKASFRDEFVSVGINQVRHCVYVDLCITVTVVGASSRISVDVKNTLPVADTVIVGRVPQFYGGYFSGINNKLE